MTIMKYLDASTGCVSKKTMDVIHLYGMVCDYKYGVFVSVPDEVPGGFPGDLKEILVYAKTHGCTLVRFDCDADRIPELPYYDW